METLNENQHYLMEVLLEAGRPVTVDEFINEYASPVESPQHAAVKQRLDRLVTLGWLTKKRGQRTGRRGKPPSSYEPVNGAQAAWTDHEAMLQKAYAEREELHRELLG